MPIINSKVEDLLLKPDPFLEVTDSKVIAPVHIRNRQRSGKKTLTTIEGLSPDLDLNQILRALRKQFKTNGTLLNKTIIQLQGDCRQGVAEFLIQREIVPKEKIIIHGA